MSLGSAETHVNEDSLLQTSRVCSPASPHLQESPNAFENRFFYLRSLERLMVCEMHFSILNTPSPLLKDRVAHPAEIHRQEQECITEASS